MFKKISFVALVAMLSACSVTEYIPFMGNNKPVINLEEDKIDQKSYAAGYASTVQTYKGALKEDYDVNSFANGAKQYYEGAILVPIEQVKAKLASGIDSNVHAYYSGVVFASDLQANFGKLSSTCWNKLDRPSITQGIYDAMIDLKKGEARSDDEPAISKGLEQLHNQCK